MDRSAWSRRRRAAVVSLLGLALSPLVAGCSSAPGPAPPPTTTITSEVTEPLPQGEIWQWALGRNAWSDPALTRLASSLGRSSKTNILAHAYGFELNLDDAGTVVAVVLYNDEDSLGLSSSETSFRAYAGTLPAGLTWRDTYGSVVTQYGPGDQQTGGWGTEHTVSYVTTDGRRLEVTYAATHSAELPTSAIHTITVRLPAQN